MNKKRTILPVFIAIGIPLLVIFINSGKTKSFKVNLNAPETAVQRQLIHKTAWSKWWPGTVVNDSTFSFEEVTYTFQSPLINGVQLQLKDADAAAIGGLSFVAQSDTSSILTWSSTGKMSSKMKSSMQKLLAHCNDVFSNQEKLYGFNVKTTTVLNPHLISIKKKFAQYPTVSEVYAMIEQLQKHADAKKTSQLNPAMLHVNPAEDGVGLEAMVAIPISFKLEEEGDFKPKFMIQGALLEAEVVGGISKVEQSMLEMKNYLQDYKLSSPAIPYQSLVSDRRTTDSSKWITKIYHPVFKRPGM